MTGCSAIASDVRVRGRLQHVLPPSVPIVCVSKGLEMGTGAMMSGGHPERARPASSRAVFPVGPLLCQGGHGSCGPTGLVAASKSERMHPSCRRGAVHDPPAGWHTWCLLARWFGFCKHALVWKQDGKLARRGAAAAGGPPPWRINTTNDVTGVEIWRRAQECARHCSGDRGGHGPGVTTPWPPLISQVRTNHPALQCALGLLSRVP